MDDVGKRLFIELGTCLQVETEGIEVPLRSELIGMEVGKYLIIKVNPLSDEKEEYLTKNNLLVKFFHKNAILGFNARTLSIISSPEHLLFISYPESIRNYNIRSSKRIDCFLPVKLEIEFNLVEGTVIDINNSGCCCNVKNLHIMGSQSEQEVIMYLYNSNSEDEFPLKGKVKSIRQTNEDSNLGIMFDPMDSDTQALLMRIIPALSF